MATFLPFKATRPIASKAAVVSCLPYDVMDRNEAKKIGCEKDSFIHVIRSEIDLPECVSPYANEVYEKAFTNLREMEASGILVTDEKPCFYLYEQTFNARVQTGFVGLAAGCEYENGIIKKHERTLPEKETDRINHFIGCMAQTEPVFFLHKADTGLEKIAKRVKMSAPEYDFTAADGVRNRLFVISDENDIKQIIESFANKDSLYIADGHHRTESVARVGSKLNNAADYPGAAYIMAVSFPDNEVKVMDYNRLLTDFGAFTRESFLNELQKDFTVRLCDGVFETTQKHVFSYYDGKHWYHLTAKQDSFVSSDPIARIDADILQKNVFDKILNITDPTVSPRLKFVGGIRGYGYLKENVDNGNFAAAFALCPVEVEDIVAVADCKMIMPPKSTWFEPKLRSGLFIHKF